MKRETASRRVNRLLLEAGRALRKARPKEAQRLALKAADAAEAFAQKYGGNARELSRHDKAMRMYRAAKWKEDDERRSTRSEHYRQYIKRRWYT